MFGKFKKEGSKKTNPDEKKVTTDNILEVFSKDMMSENKKELKNSLQKKDPVLYLDKATGALKFGFFILLFFGVSLYVYSSIQQNEDSNNLSLLNPVCGLFLGEKVAADFDGCASVSNAKKTYTENLSEIKKAQSSKILSILDEVYSIENFLFTEDVAFMIEQSSSKLPVIDILSDFNELKDAFEPTKKVYALECDDMVIENNLEIQMSCSAYSSDWSDSNIMGFNGQVNSKKISGTSISVASSFINFINQKSENFKVVDSTKVYSYSSQLEEGKERYTRKTDFDLTLKYINGSLR